MPDYYVADPHSPQERRGARYMYDTLARWARSPANIPNLTAWQRSMLIDYILTNPLLQRGRGKSAQLDKLAVRNLFEKDVKGEGFWDVARRRPGTPADMGPSMPDWLAKLYPLTKGRVSKGLRGQVVGADVPNPELTMRAILAAGNPNYQEDDSFLLRRHPTGHLERVGPPQRGPRRERVSFTPEGLWAETLGKPLANLMYKEDLRGRQPWKYWSESQRELAPSLYDMLWQKDEMGHRRRLKAAYGERQRSKSLNLFESLLKNTIDLARSAGMPGIGDIIGGLQGQGGYGGLGQPYMPQPGMAGYDEWLRNYGGGGMTYSPGFLGWGGGY